MIHVVHLTSSTFFGGPERQILGLCAHLPLHYHSSIVVFSEAGGCHRFQEEARRCGVDMRVIPDDLRGTVHAVDVLNQTLVGLDADVLCCHGYKANLIGALAGRAVGLPTLCILRGWTGENCKVKVYERFDQLVLTRFEMVVCLSRAQAQSVINAGVPRRRVRLIPNAIAISRFPPPTDAHRAELSAFFSTRPRLVCCSAGRLSPEKGFSDLVRASADVIREDRGVGFILFGDGPLRSELSDDIRRLGVEQNFVLAGFTARLDQLLAASDFVAISSYTEGMPNVLLEACAARLPVVATNVGGIPDVISQGVNGFLVPPGDVRALSSNIRRLSHSADLRRAVGDAGRALMERNFSFDAQAQYYHGVFLEILRCSTSADQVA